MPEQAANDPFVLRVEISAEQVPRLRESLSASGNDGELKRRAGEVAAREERLRAEQAELEERTRKLSEREAELGASDDLTASDRIRLAQRRQSVELSEHELTAVAGGKGHRRRGGGGGGDGGTDGPVSPTPDGGDGGGEG